MIPCWNEAGNLEALIARCARAMEGGDLSFLLVDNGSTDKSHEILQTVAGRTDGLRSIRLSRNEGYGGGILAGLATCTVDLVGWTHADLQCDPMDARRALVEARAARKPERVLVKGTREGRPWMDSMFSRGMAAFESRLLGVELSEINAQPTVFSRGPFPRPTFGGRAIQERSQDANSPNECGRDRWSRMASRPGKDRDTGSSGLSLPARIAVFGLTPTPPWVRSW